MAIRAREIKKFQCTVWDYYKKNKRAFPWRETQDPYAILVSEVMLQQTQAQRVIPKFLEWMQRFPTPESLVTARTSEVLKSWQGLGYNRRALNLKRAAEIIVKEYGGEIPSESEALLSLPGVGRYTAGAVLAFSHNIPSIFIETNIRTVYLHFFFKGRKKVRDEEILELVEKTLPTAKRVSPRHSYIPRNVGMSMRAWYCALMDYGAMLKETKGNMNRRSAHYAKQSAFNGSRRQLRGEILRRATRGAVSVSDVVTYDGAQFSVSEILHELVSEGFLRKRGGKFGLA